MNLMSSASSRETVVPPSRSLEFTQWPLRDEPLRSGAVLLGLLTPVLWAGWYTSQPWLPALAGPLLALTAWRLWLPVYYEFGPRGVTERVFRWQRRLAWREIGDLEYRRRGLILYPTPDRSALGMLRCLFVRVPPQDAERLRGLIDELWQRAQGRTATLESAATATGSTRTEPLAWPASSSAGEPPPRDP